MRGNNRVNVVVRQTPLQEKPRGYFEQNQGLIQFILVLITFITLIVSAYYSSKSNQSSKTQLEQGSDQLKQAQKQLELAQAQFKKSNDKITSDSIENINKDKIQNDRFKIQNDINIKNLEAIKLQATVAKQQLESQKEINREFTYQNRPIFMLMAVKLDSVKYKAEFTFRNLGKRAAEMTKFKFFSYNRTTKRFSLNGAVSNSDLNEFTTSTFELTMMPSEFKDLNTLYYLHFLYKDVISGRVNHFEKYFYWRYGEQNTVSWRELDPNEKNEVDSKINILKLDLSLH